MTYYGWKISSIEFESDLASGEKIQEYIKEFRIKKGWEGEVMQDIKPTETGFKITIYALVEWPH